MSIVSAELSADGNMEFKVTTAPTIEPFTVDEIKTFGRIDGDDEDDLIEGFITGVRELVEKYLGRALLEQTIVASMDFWPGAVVQLPRPPLISITEVRTVDEDGMETTYSSDYYYANTKSLPGECVINFDATEPDNTSNRQRGGYEIEFKAGYGTEATDVPFALRNALMLWVMEVYENRQMTAEPPKVIKPMLDLYKIKRI